MSQGNEMYSMRNMVNKNVVSLHDDYSGQKAETSSYKIEVPGM